MQYGESALSIACREGRTAVVQVLLDGGIMDAITNAATDGASVRIDIAACP